MLKTIELFAGIGSQSKALKRQEIPHEVVAICEWDKYAYNSYEAVHGPTPNYGDITKVESLPQCDLLTYSFPCQDLSVAGKGAGIKKGTRSGLLYEVERLLFDYYKRNELPRYLLLENVKNLVGKKHKPDFDAWLEVLSNLGYNNYWQVLNAKNYGVPQNRERVFVVSILKEHDKNVFEWPEPFDKGLRLKDFLEIEVDEKYYISDEKCAKLIASTFNQERARVQTGDVCGTLLARDYKDPKCVPCITPDRVEKRQNDRRFKEDGDPMFTLTSQDRHGVLVKANNARGYDLAEEGDSINLEHPNSKTRRGRVGLGVAQALTTSPQQAVVEANEIKQIGNLIETESFGGNQKRGRIYGIDGISPALNTVGGGGLEPKILELGKLDENRHSSVMNSVVDPNGISACLDTMQGGNRQPKVFTQYCIRKLTPKECWRLMGFDDEDFDKAEQVNSNSQLYKQAGNSIVVDVLEHIFHAMYQNELATTKIHRIVNAADQLNGQINIFEYF